MGPAPVAKVGHHISGRIVDVALSIAMNVHFFTGDFLVPNIKPVPHLAETKVVARCIVALEILINKGRELQGVGGIRTGCFPDMVLKLTSLSDAAAVLV